MEKNLWLTSDTLWYLKKEKIEVPGISFSKYVLHEYPIVSPPEPRLGYPLYLIFKAPGSLVSLDIPDLSEPYREIGGSWMGPSREAIEKLQGTLNFKLSKEYFDVLTRELF